MVTATATSERVLNNLIEVQEIFWSYHQVVLEAVNRDKLSGWSFVAARILFSAERQHAAIPYAGTGPNIKNTGALIVGQQVMHASGGWSPGVRSPDVGSPTAYRRWVFRHRL
jgi:hypothetical protein